MIIKYLDPQGKSKGKRVLPRNLLLMDKILHDLKDPKLWELWYIPCNG